jgi:hypothetical protein
MAPTLRFAATHAPFWPAIRAATLRFARALALVASVLLPTLIAIGLAWPEPAPTEMAAPADQAGLAGIAP